MPANKPKPAPKPQKPASREKFVKVEGTFEELIAKSVAVPPKRKGKGK